MPWRCISSSIAGTSHLARDLPCQDAHCVRSLENGDLVLAVADGCGSSKRSDEGARCAVEIGAEFISERLQAQSPANTADCEALLEAAMSESAAAVMRLAGEADAREWATTLLLAFITDRWLATIQVGDGAIVSRDREGKVALISRAIRGEYVNETIYITSPQYPFCTRKKTFPSARVNGIAMFTDGIEFLAVHYNDNTPHEPFFATMFEFAARRASTPEELRDFLLSDRVCERTDDDKTLVLAVRS